MVPEPLNGPAPDYLRSKLTDRSKISFHLLKDCEGKVAVPLPRTNLLRNRFSYNGGAVLALLRQAKTLTNFKSGYSGLF